MVGIASKQQITHNRNDQQTGFMLLYSRAYRRRMRTNREKIPEGTRISPNRLEARVPDGRCSSQSAMPWGGAVTGGCRVIDREKGSGEVDYDWCWSGSDTECKGGPGE